MKNKLLAILLSAVLCLSMTACSKSSEDNGISIDLKNPLGNDSEKWIDSDLKGAIKKKDKIRLQDDFAAAVNKNWKCKIGKKFYSTFQQAEDTVLSKKKKAVTDKSIPGKTASLLRNYYELASDWKYRNSQGAEPLKPYLQNIEDIQNMDELFSYFKDSKKNPLGAGPFRIETTTHYHSKHFPDRYLVLISAPDLSLAGSTDSGSYYDLITPSGLAGYEEVENKVLYLLDRLGYTKDDAKNILKNCLMWEKRVADADDSNSLEEIDDAAVDRDKVISMAGDFPLDEILNARGFQDAKAFAISPTYAKKLSSLCREGNLEKIKGYLIVSYCLASADFLDRDTYDAFERFSKPRDTKPLKTGETKKQLEDKLIFDEYIGGTAMVGAMNEVYVKNYFDNNTTKELRSLTKEVIGAFKVIFREEPWLSKKGKAACLDKLSSVGIHVAHQSFDSADYGKMKITPKEKGGSFLEAYFESCRFSADWQGKLAGKKYDKDFWDPLDTSFSTTITNAFYNSSTNGIYICAGVCEPPLYSPEMKYEEKLAGLFNVIGHEITHGFDRNGSLYDKNGFKKTWLPYADRQAFNGLDDKVAAYYSLMTPFPGSGLYSGYNVTTEATADMGGIRATLYLASKHPDFNYDLYFRSYAKIYRENVPKRVEKNAAAGDPHPLAFYRVNVGLQQFDEFYETYHIKKHDNMYLAPKKRIKVW